MRVCDGFDLIKAWRKDGGNKLAIFDERLGVRLMADAGALVSWAQRGGWRISVESLPGACRMLSPFRFAWAIIPVGDGCGLLGMWEPGDLDANGSLALKGYWQDEPCIVEVDWLRAHKEKR